MTDKPKPDDELDDLDRQNAERKKRLEEKINGQPDDAQDPDPAS